MFPLRASPGRKTKEAPDNVENARFLIHVASSPTALPGPCCTTLQLDMTKRTMTDGSFERLLKDCDNLHPDLGSFEVKSMVSILGHDPVSCYIVPIFAVRNVSLCSFLRMNGEGGGAPHGQEPTASLFNHPLGDPSFILY